MAASINDKSPGKAGNEPPSFEKTTNSEHLEDHVGLEDEPEFKWNRDVVLNVMALYILYLSAVWGQTIPGASIPFILLDYPDGLALVGWVAALPTLCLCIIQGWAAELSDILGRRWIVLFGSFSGLLGMLLGGFSTNINMLLGGQVFSGIGITLAYLATPLLAEVVPKAQRGVVLSGTVICATIASLAGSISQGAYMEADLLGANRGWRVGLYIGAGLFALAFVVIVLFYHPKQRPNPEELSTRCLLLQIDWVGIFLAASGLTLFLVGVTFGGNPHPWTSKLVLGLIIVGGLVLVAFALWEWKFVVRGLFDKELFQHRNFSVTLVLNFIEGMVVFSFGAYINQVTFALFTTDFIKAQVYGLGFTAGTVLGGVGVGLLLAKYKESKWVVIGSLIIMVVGNGLMCVVKPGINIGAFIVPCILIGLTCGCLAVTIPLIATICTPNHLIATSVGLGSSLRGLGGTLGLIIFQQIYTSKLKVKVPELVSAAVIAAGLPTESVGPLLQASATKNPSIMMAVPGVNPDILAALELATKEAYSVAFRFIWYALMPFVVISGIICLFLKPTKDQMTSEVASAVQQRKNLHELPIEDKQIS